MNTLGIQRVDSNNCDIDFSFLKAVEEKNLEMMRYYLKSGANPSIKYQIGSGTIVLCRLFNAVILEKRQQIIINSRTALHIASRNGCLEIVTELVTKYPQLIRITDSFCANALFWADATCIPILLEHNVEVFAKDKYNRTPLYTMIYNRSIKGIRLILEEMLKSPPSNLHLYRVLKNILPVVLTNLICEYDLNLNDYVYVPEYFLRYNPNCKDYIKNDRHDLDTLVRDKVGKINAFFLKYGIVLSNCRVMKEEPY